MANYSRTLNYLFNHFPMFHSIGADAYKNNLNNSITLSNIMGKPEQKFPSVHIAGTNGKGSVANMLASILQESGYKTGLFTSPHLKDFRERIRVNGEMIPKEEVTSFVATHKKIFETIHPSFFEMTFALAMQYFADQKIDIAVIETGMGGRIDSTNIIQPILSIITNISLDHTQFLGSTLNEIAAEKAGIIKKGIPVLIGKSQPKTDNVFKNVAKSMNTDIQFADKIYKIEDLWSWSERPFGSVFTMNKYAVTKFKNMYCPLSGDYQRENLQTAFAATDILNEKGITITKEGLSDGIANVLKNTGFKGRWQVRSRRPLTIFDTAHNEAGIKQVVSQINELKYNKLHFVLGMLGDKDVSKILCLLPKKATYYFCKPRLPRGLDQNVLAEQALEHGLIGRAFTSVNLAYNYARKSATKEDLIFVGGSSFVVAEVV